jgi:hypothetical protein
MTRFVCSQYRINIGIAESILGAHVTAAVHLVNAMKSLTFPSQESKEAAKKSIQRTASVKKETRSKVCKSLKGQGQSHGGYMRSG